MTSFHKYNSNKFREERAEQEFEQRVRERGEMLDASISDKACISRTT